MIVKLFLVEEEDKYKCRGKKNNNMEFLFNLDEYVVFETNGSMNQTLIPSLMSLIHTYFSFHRPWYVYVHGI